MLINLKNVQTTQSNGELQLRACDKSTISTSVDKSIQRFVAVRLLIQMR